MPHAAAESTISCAQESWRAYDQIPAAVAASTGSRETRWLQKGEILERDVRDKKRKVRFDEQSKMYSNKHHGLNEARMRLTCKSGPHMKDSSESTNEIDAGSWRAAARGAQDRVQWSGRRRAQIASGMIAEQGSWFDMKIELKKHGCAQIDQTRKSGGNCVELLSCRMPPYSSPSVGVPEEAR